jgi:fatty-acyl-CoA synthase
MSWTSDSLGGQAPPIDPSRPAVACGSEPALSWEEFRSKELSYASALHRAGIRKGDRVAMLLKNSVDYIVFNFAIARTGAIAVRLNWRLAPPELSFIIKDSGATLMLVDDDLVEKVVGIRDEIPVRSYVVRGDDEVPDWATPIKDFLRGEVTGDFPELGLDDPASLMYTSGTTGLPKGAIWTHGNYLWFGAMQGLQWKFDSSTVALTSGPLFHAGGWEALLMAAMVNHGTAVTYPSGNFELTEYLHACRVHKATDILLYSFLLVDFIRRDDCRELLPPSVRRIVTGADSVMPWVYDEFVKKLPDVELIQVYGSTEAGAISTSLGSEYYDRTPSVGRSMPFADVRVLGPEGEVLAPHAVGELYVRSPACSPGYWNRPEANAETFVDGWCRTGDLASIDEDGFVTLRGRAKDMIRSAGENIYPAEVEAVLTTAPGVADAAVIAVPDPTYAEVGCAILIAKPGETIDVESVRAFCVERMARYKVPKHFVIESELPRTPSGKVQKYRLRDQYEDLGQRMEGVVHH